MRGHKLWLDDNILVMRSHSLSLRDTVKDGRHTGIALCFKTIKLKYNFIQHVSMKLLQDYTIVICPDDNGTFVAYIPGIPGCHAWGKTLDEARAEIVNVFEMIKEEYEEQGQIKD